MAAVAGLAFSTPAAAQDFGGLRVEGRVGYQSVNLEADFRDEDDLSGDERQGGCPNGSRLSPRPVPLGAAPPKAASFAPPARRVGTRGRKPGALLAGRFRRILPRMKFATLAAAMLLAVRPGAALACSPVFDPRPREVQQDEWARKSYSKAQVLAEVVALQGSRRHGWGLVRVVRVLKGPVRPGRIFRLRAVDSGLCGAGHFRRGSSGLTLIDRVRGDNDFHGYLDPGYLPRLDRLGLRPTGAPMRRR